MGQKQLKEKLSNMCLSVLTKMSIYTYEKIISLFIERLHALLEVSYTSIFRVNQWTNLYELVYDIKKEEDLQEINHIIHVIREYMNTSTMTCHPEIKIDGHYELIKLPIYQASKLSGYMIIVNQKNVFNKNDFHMIKREIERFFSIVHHMNHFKTSKEKNKLLFHLSTRLYTTTNRTMILKEIISAIQSLYPNFSFYILLSQDLETDDLLPVKSIEYSDEATKRVSTKAFITGDVQLEERVKERHTCLYAPLKGKQGVYGVLQIVSPNIVCFPHKDIEFIKTFANVTGQAIENATMYQTSNHLVTDLKLINHVTHKLNSNLKLSEIITIMKEQMINICHPTHIGFIYYKEDTDAVFDLLPGSSSYFNTEEGETFTNYLAQRMKEKPESIFSGDFTKKSQLLSYRSMMAIPMKQGSTLTGFIVMLHKESSAFSFENFKLMESMIQHSALALANAILKDQLEKAVITDYLTQLYSRSYLDEMIHMHMKVDETGALVLFDIDDFKEINDTYGHHIGDQVIIQVADILLACSDNGNIPALWGGEELALYLPHATLGEGVKIAGDIRRKVEMITQPKVTLSSGVSTWTEGIDDNVDDLFIRADRALYDAKGLGKNRVVTERYSR